MPTVSLVLALAAAGCGTPSPRGIVLVTLDTTRADRLGCYGYDRAATPNLDALAAESVRFSQAMAPVPVTLPSHATMFTGNYPPVHGIRYNGMFRLRESSVTVAEILRDAGWTTEGIPASYPLNEATGIGQGFQVYRDMFKEDGDERPRSDTERQAAETSRLALEFLDQVGDEPFFLWIHYWDAHYPYQPPFPYSARYRDRPYDGEIAYTDQELGKVFDRLRERGLWDRVLVIVAGDHGEGLYDHNEKMHANLVYQSTMRVPLIVKPPGSVSPAVVSAPVTLADVAPTILDFAGQEGPEMEGVSLKPAVYGKSARERPIYFESQAGSLTYGWSPLAGIRKGKWKYVRSPSPELFDLESDPGEDENLRAERGDLAGDLEQALRDLEAVWSGQAASPETAPIPLDAKSLEMLASLGYVGGAATEESQDGPNPEAMIHLEQDIFTAREEIAAGEFLVALERLESLLSADPTNRLAMQMASQAAFGAGKPDLAIEYLKRALEVAPDFVAARVRLGEIYVSQHNLTRAEEIFREGVEKHPQDQGLNYRLAVALFALDRPREAQEIAETVLERGTQFPTFLVLHAACRAKLGDPDGALRSLRRAVEYGYDDREVLREEPLLEPLRAVPGFEEVLRSIPE